MPIPKHEKVRKQTRAAIRQGRLVRQPCEICDNPETDAHHDDYDKPLEVRWLCQTHHSALHVDLGTYKGRGRPAKPIPDEGLAAQLRDVERRYQRAADREHEVRRERRDLVLRLLDEGWTHAKIAEVAGHPRGWVSQVARR